MGCFQGSWALGDQAVVLALGRYLFAYGLCGIRWPLCLVAYRRLILAKSRAAVLASGLVGGAAVTPLSAGRGSWF
jgi:hypothetical protein